MTSTRSWLISTLAVAALATMASSEVGANVNCARRAELHVTHFGRFAEHTVASCLRRSARGKAACPNARLADQLARRRAAMVSGFGRRCSGEDLDSQLATVAARVLCDRLAICGPPLQSITVRVGHEGAGGAAAAQRSAAPPRRGLLIAHDRRALSGLPARRRRSPQLGEAGTCNGGPNAGLPCTVGGLAGPEYGSKRGTSNDCPPEPTAQLAEFVVDATATTNGVTFGTSAESPDCRAAGLTGLKCLFYYLRESSRGAQNFTRPWRAVA